MKRRVSILLLIVVVIGLGAIPFAAGRQDARVTDKWLDEFRATIYPLLSRSVGGCFECHSTDESSDLMFSGNVDEDFIMLIEGQFLDDSGPNTLLARISSENVDLRMPQDHDRWTDEEIKRLTKFIVALGKDRKTGADLTADERFPSALLQPYRSEKPGGIDNQFITYRQLKSKIAVIFEDDWIRNGKDLFAENVALFGGADFETRFNETDEPNAGFLTGLEMMATDVAHRAYQQGKGPFFQLPKISASPLVNETPTPEYDEVIRIIYQRVLYRSPNEEEINQAYLLLKRIYQEQEAIAIRNQTMVFELTAKDPITGLENSQAISIPVNGDRLEVFQQLVDQSRSLENEEGPVVSRIVGPDIRLAPGKKMQRLVIHNLGTHRNVSFAGVKISNIDGDEPDQMISVSSPEVQVDGAWELNKRQGATSLEDKNNHKGQSRITVGLNVAKAGLYRVTLLWRKNADNADNVLIELFGQGRGNRLVSTMKPNIPQPGKAHFTYDCGNDAVPYFQPEPVFQFDREGFVEISNAGTRKRVTAGAVEFLEYQDSGQRVLVDSRQAEGNEGWTEFDAGRFKAYNVKGKKLHDDNKQKGELSLRYHLPAGGPDQEDIDQKSTKKLKGEWRPDKFYHVRIYYPGKTNQESQVPVVIKGLNSSPIIQLQYPRIAKSDARLRLDASKSFTVQQSELEFSWRQISGTPVELGDSSRPTIEFKVPRPSIRQFAWSSLCAALIQHPDFLFTRPPSFYSSRSAEEKQAMQLVKVALDLVGRPPTPEELDRLKGGAELSELIDTYLDTQEFRDDYFHRIRLMLESHGTDQDDEAARIWSYVAYHDRPFQEILTGDYSVDSQFTKQPRPAYHGKTGLLTTRGFIQGKPGLPHYNYAAQVSMLFLGYVYEVPDEIVEQREGVTALGTTDPNSVCYSCHKILTPLAFQRLNWTDDGDYRTVDENNIGIDASDRGSVTGYPFAGDGLEAFTTKAVRKERFIRSMINTHVNFYFGRPLRHRLDERRLYKSLWDNVHANNFRIRELIRAILESPEYLEGGGNRNESM